MRRCHGLRSCPEGELQKAADDVNYEMRMLRECSQRLRRPPHDPVLRNALIESYLLHLRNLFHFLGVREQRHERGRDVLAEHFVVPWKRPDCPAALRGQMDRVNKRLAHLTYERLTMSDQWDVRPFTGAMAGLVGKFLFALKGRQGWFQEAQNAAFWQDGVVVRWSSTDQSVMTTTVSVSDVVEFSRPDPGGSERGNS
jgi:hypothetical protein